MTAKLRDDVRELLRRLRQYESPLPGWLRDDPRPHILEAIARSGEYRAVPDLLPLLSANDTLSPAVARTISTLVAGISPSQLAWLDAQARGFYSIEFGVGNWFSLQPADVPDLCRGIRPHWGAIGILASHPNGFVRQIAVRQLGRSTDGDEIPFLAMRANDWVPDVSTEATSLLAARFIPVNRTAMLQAIPFIARLLGQHRHNHERLADAFSTVLLGADVEVIQARLETVDTAVARTVYSMLLGSAPADHAILVGALEATDPGVRRAAVRRFASQRSDEITARLMTLSRTDSAPGVRKEALTQLTEQAPDRLRPLLADFLLDPSARIRLLAQYLAGKLDPALDVRTLYRIRLNDDRRARRAAAIAGLGETGTRDDASAVERWLNDVSARIRRSALRALARLDADRALPAALSMLEDPSPSVRAAAGAIVSAQQHLVDFNALHSRWQQSNQPDVRAEMLVLLAQAPKWDAVGYLLDALVEHADDPVLAQASRLLNEWMDNFNRSQLQPSPAHVQRIRTRLDSPTSRVGARAERFLRFVVDER